MDGGGDGGSEALGSLNANTGLPLIPHTQLP